MVVALPVLLSFLLLLPGLQTRLVGVVTNRISHDLNTEISIGRVQVSPFTGIRLKNFLVRDLKSDTLFFSKGVNASIDHFSLFRKHLYLGTVKIESPLLRFSEQEEGMNFDFLFQQNREPRPDSVRWHYSVRGAEIQNGQLRFTHSILKNPAIKHDTLLFSRVNMEMERTSSLADSLAFKLNDLSLTERNGLTVNTAGAFGHLIPGGIVVRDFFLETPSSSFHLDRFELSASPEEASLKEKNQRFALEISKMEVSPAEAALFFNDIPAVGSPFGLSGEVFGTFNNLKGRNVIASLGQQTFLSTAFDLNDLSDFSQTFVFLDVKMLQTTASDLERLLGLAGTEALPPSFHQMGVIRFKGNLTGFFNDLVAYGDFNTALGTIRTDLGIKLNDSDQLFYSGFLSTRGFHLGRLLGASPQMGTVTMDMEVKGNRKSSTDFFALLNGNINALTWNDYVYRDVTLNGLITHQRFDGAVSFDDANASFRFDGEIDMSREIPRFHFLANIQNAQLDRMNLVPSLQNGVLTATVDANFEGANLDDLIGDIGVYEGLLYTPEASLEIDSLTMKAVRENDQKRITLESEFLEGELSGQYYFRNFRKTLLGSLHYFLPSLADDFDSEKKLYNDFKFELTFLGMEKLLGVVYPGLTLSGDGSIKGRFNALQHFVNLRAAFDRVELNNTHIRGFELYMDAHAEKPLSVTTRAEQLSVGNLLSLYNFALYQKARNDTLDVNVFWNNWDSVTNSGALYTTTSFGREGNGSFYANTLLHPSKVILGDSIWNLSESRALITSENYSIQGFKMSHAEQELSVNGFLHRRINDGLKLMMSNIDLAQFFGQKSASGYTFSGVADGSVEVKDFFRAPTFHSDFRIDRFGFNGDTIGLFSLSSEWDTDLKAMAVETSVKKNGSTTLIGTGTIGDDKNLNLNVVTDSLQISFLNAFLENILQDIEGTTSGNLYLSGSLNKPFLTGKVKVNRGRFNVDMLNTSYQLKDSVWFYPNEIRFKNLTITDRDGHQGNFKGSIYHDGFKDMVYNLRMDITNMLVLDTRLRHNPYYYGTVYGTGNMTVTGSSQIVNLDISAQTRENTRFFIPTQDTGEALQSNFIRFVSPNGNNNGYGATPDEPEYSVDLSGLEMNMEIDVTPEARVQIIFDSTVGDILQGQGEGSIQIRIGRQGDIGLFGSYTIERGEYLFSLQNLVNKRFEINKGGTVTWRGDPFDAEIDLTAVYKLKASLSDLLGPLVNSTGGQSNNDVQRRIPIHTNLMLSGPLEKPGIKFGIEAPTLTESTESYMLDVISTEDELNRQVLSLLVLNRFYMPDYVRVDNSSALSTNRAALVTTAEVLSNQLSRWLSTISSDVDVGVSYRPEDNLSSEEIEVALSTQMFNNRVTINGNVGYGKYETNTSKMVGDFDMDLKLNPSGTLRAKVYTRSNDDLIYETSPTTQGIGISFKEEFDDFKDLVQKYWDFVRRKRKEAEPSSQASLTGKEE